MEVSILFDIYTYCVFTLYGRYRSQYWLLTWSVWSYHFFSTREIFVYLASSGLANFFLYSLGLHRLHVYNIVVKQCGVVLLHHKFSVYLLKCDVLWCSVFDVITQSAVLSTMGTPLAYTNTCLPQTINSVSCQSRIPTFHKYKHYARWIVYEIISREKKTVYLQRQPKWWFKYFRSTEEIIDDKLTSSLIGFLMQILYSIFIIKWNLVWLECSMKKLLYLWNEAAANFATELQE